MSARPFNPWNVPSDPFPPTLLGAMNEGEVRYVSIEQIFVTPAPMGIFWVSRAAPATHLQTDHNRTAIELKDDIYWVWLSPREGQLVLAGEPVEPTVWAIPLRIVSEATMPGVRPPADRPQPRRPVVVDPRDPASTSHMLPQYLVVMDTAVAGSPADDCEALADAAADCSQDATIQIDTTPLTDSGAASTTPHTTYHDPGVGHSHDAGGGSWADSGGFDGGAASCGGGGF